MPGFPFTHRSRPLLLLLGALAGLLLALSGLIDKWALSSGALPDNVVARVGDLAIPEERYFQVLNDLAADKRAPLTAADRNFVLDRLIDEELLILRGIELGLAESSPEVRKAIAAAVIAQVAAEAEAAIPTEAELRHLYESDPEFFATTARYRLHWWRSSGSGEEARQAALRAYDILVADARPASGLSATGVQRVNLLPDEMLPLTKIADYLGPALTMKVPELNPGTYSRPIAAGDRFHILHLFERQEGGVPPLAEIRPVVEAEYDRRAGQKALSDYLQWLRQRTQITVNPALE
jgi:hypothetical protein